VRRVCIVVHPTRRIADPLATLRAWTEARGIDIVQLYAGDQTREVAPIGEAGDCDLVVAIGGDGTVLAALRAAAAGSAPVLGVACGSLGVLTAVSASELEAALDAFESGAWTPRSLPRVEVSVDGRPAAWGLNDFVLVRRAGQQLMVDVTIGGERYARIAGDGVVVATPLGSSAYSMAAGGPLLVTGNDALVVTPLVVHGGYAPPAVVPSVLEVTLDAVPGFGGFDVEIDGQAHSLEGTSFTARLVPGGATLVTVGEPTLGLTALRGRGLITDSPRALARDAREAREREAQEAPDSAGSV
jgi:NAD+ kinase